LDETTDQKPETFTDWVRIKLKNVLDAIAGFFNRLGIHPNIITISSLAGNITGAVFVGFGHLTIGGLIVLVTAPLDAIDGAMARSEAR